MNYRDFNEKCVEIERNFKKDIQFCDGIDTKQLKGCKNILNFGCGDSTLDKECFEYDLEIRVDNDPAARPDYEKIEDIPQEIMFDGVLAEQCFEHIEKDNLEIIINNISNKMRKDAIIIASIPNVFNWVKYISDYDHKSPLAYTHLGALFEINDIEVSSIYYYSKERRFQRLFDLTKSEKEIMSLLVEFFELIPADYVVVVGNKR